MAEGCNPHIIVTIDAGLKLEGEDSGIVQEGVGTAIGGIGVERYKIEEVATANDIPLYAIIVWQSIKEAISEMTEEIRGSIPEVCSRLDRLVNEKTKPGNTVLIVGVGNTIGVE
ncbi:MAG: DUF1512 family protein [Candidatus Nealsonbacteria bacterium]|nr:DUF1512 family protein [Candidatus Nealsonbacteria bacterium]